MAAQPQRAGACFMPFYRLNKANAAKPIRKRWAPNRTGQTWEDWNIGEAYAKHFIACIQAGDVSETDLVAIIADMGSFLKNSDWCAIGFVDEIGRRLKKAA